MINMTKKIAVNFFWINITALLLVIHGLFIYSDNDLYNVSFGSYVAFPLILIITGAILCSRMEKLINKSHGAYGNFIFNNLKSGWYWIALFWMLVFMAPMYYFLSELLIEIFYQKTVIGAHHPAIYGSGFIVFGIATFLTMRWTRNKMIKIIK